MKNHRNFSNRDQSSYPSVDKSVRSPIASLEAEKAVLGGILLDPMSWNKIEHLIDIQDFYYQKHQVLYKNISKIMNGNAEFDLVILHTLLDNQNLLEQSGGMSYLVELVENTPSSDNIELYVEIVKEKSILRNVLSAVKDIADQLYNPQERSTAELLDFAEQKILSVSANVRGSKNQGPLSIKDIVPIAKDRLDQGVSLGISSGFPCIDKITSGLHSGNLIIVAGRPTMGKTTLAMNMVEHISRNSKFPVLVFSLEMSAPDLIYRMVASVGKVEYDLLQSTNLSPSGWQKVFYAFDTITENMNLYIDDNPHLTTSELRSKSRKVYNDHGGLSLIVIDYLQLMTFPGQENRTQEVAQISRSLKALARELNIPVIAISQLNRSADERIDKRPVLSDLRDSGALEQDADLIAFVYREEVYSRNANDKGLGEIIIAKHRNGPIGKALVSFNGRFCNFSDDGENL